MSQEPSDFAVMKHQAAAKMAAMLGRRPEAGGIGVSLHTADVEAFIDTLVKVYGESIIAAENEDDLYGLILSKFSAAANPEEG